MFRTRGLIRPVWRRDDDVRIVIVPAVIPRVVKSNAIIDARAYLAATVRAFTAAEHTEEESGQHGKLE